MMESRERAIGRIEGKLDLLIEEQGRETQKRRELHQKIDTIQRKQDYINRHMTEIEQRLERVEKPVAEFNKWRERMIGAAILINLIAAIIGGSAVVFWQKIIAFIQQWQ